MEISLTLEGRSVLVIENQNKDAILLIDQVRQRYGELVYYKLCQNGKVSVTINSPDEEEHG